MRANKDKIAMDISIKPRPPRAAPLPGRRPSRSEAERAVRTLIAWAGDDPLREGLVETPHRVASAFGEFFGGYGQDPSAILGKTFKNVGGYDDMILERDIPFSSHCEHHMVPFVGRAHIAYMPRDGVVGLSKLVRLVEVYARRLQTQENLTAQIIDALDEAIEPRGAAVMLEAEHMCMTMRGVRAHGVLTVTHRFSGVFAEDRSEQDRFYTLLGRRP